MESYGNEREFQQDMNDDYDSSKWTGRNGTPGRGTSVKGNGKVKGRERD